MKKTIVRGFNVYRSLNASVKVCLAVMIVGALLLASPHGSSGQNTNRTIKIVVTKPEVKEGGLTSTAFSDRLIAALKREPGFEIGFIENAIDRGKAKQDAAAMKYDFILFTTVSSKEDKSFGSVIGKLGRKELRFKVQVEYALEAVSGGNPLLNGKEEANERKVEESVGKIVDKITKDVAEKARQAIAAAPAPPTTPIASQPSPQPAPAPVTTIRSVGTPTTAPRLVVQTAHSTMVTDFAYSSDAKLLATLGSDGIVKLWNTESQIEINTFSGYRTVGIAFSPNGKTVAALGKDGVIRLFDTVSGRLERRLSEIERSKPKREKDTGDLFNLPVSVAFGPEGRFIVSGSENGVKVFEVESGKHLRTLLKDKEIAIVAVSPDGIHIAAVVDDNEVKVYSTATGKQVKAFHGKVGVVTALVFSQNGQSLLLGSRYGTIRQFDIAKGEEIGKPVHFQPCDKPYEAIGGLGPLRKVPGVKGVGKTVGDTCEIAKDIGDLFKGRWTVYYETSVRSLALNPNGNLLAWSLGDNTVRVTDLKDRKDIYSIEPETKPKPAGALPAITSSLRPGGSQDNPQSPSAGDTAKATGGDQKAQLVIAEFFQQLAPVRFSTDGKTLNSVREFKTVGRWDALTGKTVSSLAVAKRDLSGGFPFPVPWGSVPVFGSTADTLVTGSLSKGTKLWDLKHGMAPMQIANSHAIGNKLPISPDSQFVVQVAPDPAAGKDMKKITVREVLSEKEVKNFSVKCIAAEPEFSPDNKYMAVRTYERGRFLTEASWLRLYDLSTGKEVFKKKYVSHFDFSPDGKLLVMRLDKDEKSEIIKIPFTSRKDDIMIVKVGGTWEEIFKEKAEDSESGSFSSRVVFNTDASLIASLDFTVIKVWEIATGKVIAMKPLDFSLDMGNLIFQPNKKVITFTTSRSLNHWDITTNQVKTSSLLTDFWGNLDYSADGKTLALGGAENRVRLFDVENEREIGSLIVPSQNDWLVMTPEGRLDTSRLDEVEEVHWILPGEPFSSQPLELFMRDFYEPRLMSRLVAGDNNFKAISDLNQRNRTLPEVAITSITPDSPDSVKVTVQVKNTFSKTQFDANGKQYQSEVHDLRLFRDGQLVGYVDGPALATGRNEDSKTFTVRLPHVEGRKQFEFSAYAFNNSQVKCLTQKRVYEPATPIAPMKGKVYLISMGVNASENPKFDLRFAANDAIETQKSLSATLRGSGRYSAVIEVPLISDYKTVNGKTTLENNATKEAFKAVIERLAGRIPQIPPALASSIPNAGRVEKATPDDLVLISFAGHGYADKNGVFYLVPYNIGKDRALADVLDRCISSNELSVWLRDVDAADMILIVDACHSAAAIEGNDFKPGPMGSRGLGQLSYDKGMQILAATQKDDVALELQRLQHGLLTFTLIMEGIDGKAADHQPADKKIMTTEWLRFAVRRVPKLYQDLRLGNPITTADGKKREVKIVGNITPSTNPKAIDAQQPALFDFLWKRNEVVLANLQ